MEMKLWAEISANLNILKAKFGNLNTKVTNPSIKAPSYDQVKPEIDLIFSKIINKIEVLQQLQLDMEQGGKDRAKEEELERLIGQYKDNVVLINKFVRKLEEDKERFDIE